MKIFLVITILLIASNGFTQKNEKLTLIEELRVGRTTLSEFKNSNLYKSCKEENSKAGSEVKYLKCIFDREHLAHGHLTFVTINDQTTLLTYIVNFQNNKKKPANMREVLLYETLLKNNVKDVKTLELKEKEIPLIVMPFAIYTCNKAFKDNTMKRCKYDFYKTNNITYKLTYIPVKGSKLFFNLVVMDTELLKNIRLQLE